MCGRHRRIGRARDRWLLLLELRMVESMGVGGLCVSIGIGTVMGMSMGVRRMFPSLVRKLRHGPLCEGRSRGRSRDTARGPITEACSATDRG
jgi:hypothetical protein